MWADQAKERRRKNSPESVQWGCPSSNHHLSDNFIIRDVVNLAGELMLSLIKRETVGLWEHRKTWKGGTGRVFPEGN